MSLSGSTNFTVNRDELIASSYRLIRVIDPNEAPNARLYEAGAESLNLMLKAWMADGMQLWVLKDKTITLTQGKASYTLGPSGDVVMDRPLSIVYAFIRDSNEDTPLNIVPREEYLNLGNKSTEGTPHQIYYDPQLTNGVLYVYNPADANAAANKVIHIKYQKPFDDMDNDVDDFEFPQEWLMAVKFGLAYYLSFEHGITPARQNFLLGEMMRLKDIALGWDAEKTSIQFGVEHENPLW